MLKDTTLVKSGEQQAIESLRDLLEQISIVQVEGIDAAYADPSEWRPDFMVRLHADGQPRQLICGYRSNGQPRFARLSLLQLRDYATRHAPEATPVFIAPYLSPTVRHLCRAHGVGYIDFTGNAWIAFGGVYIERSVADKPAAEHRELKSLFKPKSATVLRVLLREPGRAWRVTELSNVSGVSLGHVSNVRTALMDREWARVSDEGLVLFQPDMLPDAWRDSYAAPSGERLCFYTPLHGRAFDEAARPVLSTDQAVGRAAYASFSAAQWLAPYARTGTHYFLADKQGLGGLRAVLNLKSMAQGENVVVTLPKDLDLLADTVEPAPGVICTSPVQTYLDLSIAGERGAEAAEHLRRKVLSWPK